MTSYCESVDDLDLDPKLTGALRKAGLTDPRHVLTLSSPDIQRLARLSKDDVSHLKDIAAERLTFCKPVTALDIHQGNSNPCLQSWKLSTNCDVINEVLRGGIISGVITEITGESACGKTQLCLQLCISVQMNSLQSGGAVYICTEDVFPSKRLQQLIGHYSSSSVSRTQSFGDNIYIEHIADFGMLDFCVNRKLPALLSRGSARLVVIDSVTALFRCHYDSSQTVERAKHLTKFASSLHRLALQHNIPIVCVNQVSASVSGSGSGDESLIPALGLTWANQVTCRITMSRPPVLCEDIVEHQRRWRMQNTGALFDPSYRRLKLVFAPHIPQNEISVYVDQTGIHGISTELVILSGNAI